MQTNKYINKLVYFIIHFGWLRAVHPPSWQSSGACARSVAMGCSEGGGASALLQLSMVAYGSQRGFGYVRDASIVTLRGFKTTTCRDRYFRCAAEPTER